jgi:hypothetical protein
MPDKERTVVSNKNPLLKIINKRGSYKVFDSVLCLFVICNEMSR